MLYPIGIQNFEKIREGGYAYVDKTHLIHKMTSSQNYFFLSRPRRFGKSLLVSTMESYFKGRKELFKGLAIEKLEKDWVEYPVLHLDLTGKAYNSQNSLLEILNYHLSQWEKEYGKGNASESDIETRFKEVIDSACKKTNKQVVILIDEYDKPIVDNLTNPELSEYFRTILQGLYSVLKAKDGQIRFGFLTGVSKIGKISVFSGMNNLIDISMEPLYSDICGISEKDLHNYFNNSTEELAAANQLTLEACYKKLKEMYDGYHFSENSEGVYNPFSLLSTFRSNKFHEYWFETGTPTMLVNLMKQTSFDITRLTDKIVVSDSDLSGMQDIIKRPIPLFVQTGYLTIKDYDKEFHEYTLGFPNDEVKNAFLKFIFSYYIPINSSEGNTTTSNLARALRLGKPEEFMQILDSLFANTTYQIQSNAEKDFQYAMYIIMELLGEYIEAEHHTSNGRIDLLAKTQNYIYIFELKTNSSAASALQQIEEKGYAIPFKHDSRKIFKIGVNFSTQTRRIDDWKIIE